MDTQPEEDLLLGSDPARFETLLSQLTVPSNEQRWQAERNFNLLRQNNANMLVLKLSKLLRSSATTRGISAILLRILLSEDLSLYTISQLKTSLLTCLGSEIPKSVIKLICDTISELASLILPKNGWPELLPVMYDYVLSDSHHNQEVAFLLFAQLSQNIGKNFRNFIPDIERLHCLFLDCFTASESLEVKSSALLAVISFMRFLSSSGDRGLFQNLLLEIMGTLSEALNGGQEATAQEALKLLIEWVGMDPTFLTRQLVEVVGNMLQIAETESLQEGTRHLAIEFVTTLSEAGMIGMMRKFPDLIRRLTAILMHMLCDINEDEPTWNIGKEDASKDEDEYDLDIGELGGEDEDLLNELDNYVDAFDVEDETTWDNSSWQSSNFSSNFSVGQECLDRLAIGLGGSTVVPIVYEHLMVFLAAHEWEKRHAALIALAQLSKRFSKVMIKSLIRVVPIVVNLFRDPDRRVKWAAINAIGELCKDLGPDLQNWYHKRVVPALVEAMSDIENPRIQEHALLALVNFSENCTADILRPYLHDIWDTLFILDDYLMVSEGVRNALELVWSSCLVLSWIDLGLDIDLRDKTPTVHSQRLNDFCFDYMLADLISTFYRIECGLPLDFELSPQSLIDYPVVREKLGFICENGLYTVAKYPVIPVPRDGKHLLIPEPCFLRYRARLNRRMIKQPDDVKRILINHFSKKKIPVGGGLHVDESRFGIVEPYMPPLDARPNHAVLIVGVNTMSTDVDEHFVTIKNTGGEDWGDEGFTRVRFEAFQYLVMPVEIIDEADDVAFEDIIRAVVKVIIHDHPDAEFEDILAIVAELIHDEYDVPVEDVTSIIEDVLNLPGWSCIWN